ncbi:phage baseplate assembly protein V [Serratia sp. MF2]|uniref:phage baseplate assembly protein V n=1 Tax=Serratia sp. MF1(2023) TaxID=3059171 RepID=UPI0027FF6B63|nr:phage baseplate assembly protein V [Serratia sp. MF1(2023)]MDQ7104215.1 phage baseplate assembly protein V [Serratia sp. MF1(2023)]
MDDLIKIGLVVSHNVKDKTVRVQFSDLDDVVSYDLHMLFRRTGRDKDAGGLPDIGENVVCLFLPNGDEVGFVIGSYYNNKIQSPDNSQSKVIHWITENGAEISLDRESGELKAIGITSAIIEAAESIVATAPEITINGNVSITGNLSISGTSDFSGKVDMKAGASIDGIEFSSHTHGGVQTGSGSTLAPNK